MITVRRSRWLKRRLFFQRGDDGGIIEHINRPVEGTEAGLVREQLSERDFALAGLRKLWPELGDATRQFDPALVQKMQQACAAEAFGRRPKEHDRVGGPRHLAFCVAKSATQFKDRFSILPNGYRCAELAEAHEVFLEKRRKSVAKFVRGKLHQ